jgi:carbon-monoxide dehydrogenase large subunit
MRFGLGQPVRRSEDPRLLRGEGRYVADIPIPGALHGVVVRSPHAHARVRSVDVSAALAAPGVAAVLTAADLAADGISSTTCPVLEMLPLPGKRTRRPALAADRVRHVGEGVAFVVAETRAQAEDAAELVEVAYDDLPAVVGIAEAVRDGAPAVWDDAPGNRGVVFRAGDRSAVEAAFARADVVVEIEAENRRVGANPLEPRACAAEWDRGEGRFTLWTSTQTANGLQALAAQAFGMPASAFRVVSPDVGGSFGLKAELFPEDVLTLAAARRTGRPVRWTATRSESLVSDSHGRGQRATARMALSADGRILALEADALHDLGAYVSTHGVIPLQRGVLMYSGVYAIPAVSVRAQGVFTNAQPTSPYRGAGRPEVAYLVERLMDRAARRLGLDPAEIRRRNAIPPSAMPWTTPVGAVYDSGDFPGALEAALRMADWGGREARRAEAEARGRRYGMGVACWIEVSSFLDDRAELRMGADGTLSVVAPTHSHGQGHATVYAQMTAEWLGVDPARVRLVQGDTDRVPLGRGTFGSRSMAVAGSALRLAADRLADRARAWAAHLMECAPADVELADGAFRVVGTDRRVDWAAVARAAHAPGAPAELGLGLAAEGTAGGRPNYPNGVHVAAVEVDPETGAVEVVGFWAVDDVGRTLNPLLLEGQTHGGIAQGIGQALMEEVVHEPVTGQLLSGSFMDYAMPRATDVPSIRAECRDVPTPTNPLGVKGGGEGGAVGAPPAVVNAILDALAPLGVEDVPMPATPERVWRAIRDARGAS